MPLLTDDEIAIMDEEKVPRPAGNERIENHQIPAPTDPYEVANAIVQHLPAPHVFWRGDFYKWVGTNYEYVEKSEIRNFLYRFTGSATYLAPGKNDGEFISVKWAPTARKIANVMEAMAEGVLLQRGEEERCMAFINGVLPSVTRRSTITHKPERFNLTCRPFAYDPTADCSGWLNFLESVLPRDQESQQTIQEWFGYVLSERTDLQKIGVLIGPPRSGKGTINRVLRAMVGEANFAAPTMSRFDNQFALAGLIGKSIATFGDVRWNNKAVPGAVETMLTISGGDPISIPRKNRDDWNGILGTRFMLISNDAPTFTDASGALASRMVFVEFSKSFYGQEDTRLESRLMKELPGIFNWALEGAARLARNGRFTQSADANDLRQEVMHGSSPIMQWADEWCDFGRYSENIEVQLQSFRGWLEKNNSSLKPNGSRFSRELRAALASRGVRTTRTTVNGNKTTLVHGMRVRPGAQIEADNVITLPVRGQAETDAEWAVQPGEAGLAAPTGQPEAL